MTPKLLAFDKDLELECPGGVVLSIRTNKEDIIFFSRHDAEKNCRRRKNKKKEKEKKAAAAASAVGTAPENGTAEDKAEVIELKKNDSKAKKAADKKVPKHVREMQEALARRQEAEERKKREEEERLRKEEEERRRQEELERQAEDARRRKKERENEKLQKKKVILQ